MNQTQYKSNKAGMGETAASNNCRWCGIELINGACINMCWLLAGDASPYVKLPSERSTAKPQASPTKSNSGEVKS